MYLHQGYRPAETMLGNNWQCVQAFGNYAGIYENNCYSAM